MRITKEMILSAVEYLKKKHNLDIGITYSEYSEVSGEKRTHPYRIVFNGDLSRTMALNASETYHYLLGMDYLKSAENRL